MNLQEALDALVPGNVAAWTGLRERLVRTFIDRCWSPADSLSRGPEGAG